MGEGKGGVEYWSEEMPPQKSEAEAGMGCKAEVSDPESH